MEKLARYLRVSPLKLRSKSVASVRSRVVNLCQICRLSPWGPLLKVFRNPCRFLWAAPPARSCVG
jgi:hypothetical protein